MSLTGLCFEKHKLSRARHAGSPSLMDWLIRPSGMETPEAQWNPHKDPHISAYPLRAGLPGIQSWKGPLGSASPLRSLRGSQERHREGQGVVGPRAAGGRAHPGASPASPTQLWHPLWALCQSQSLTHDCVSLWGNDSKSRVPRGSNYVRLAAPGSSQPAAHAN